MANVKISELSASAALTGTELVPIVQGTTTVRTTAQDIADLAVITGGTVSTSSLLTTASVSLNTITFTKGDGSQFSITANTGSFSGSFTGRLIGTSSWANSASWSPAAGVDTQIQFNSGSTFSGSVAFRYVYVSQSLEQGDGVIASGQFSHAQGRQFFGLFDDTSTEARGLASHAEGIGAVAIGTGSHAEGQTTQAIGGVSHAEGINTISSGSFSHAEGRLARALGDCSHAEGDSSDAIGEASHAEGIATRAMNTGSHAEGDSTQAIGRSSHAEGLESYAVGESSHAEGRETIASGSFSHAEGYDTIASGSYSHAEGDTTRAIGQSSHAEGFGTQAIGDYSHVEGFNTRAIGNYSHAAGFSTVALGDYQSVVGRFNASSSNSSTFIVGNGSADNDRRNLFIADPATNTVVITGSLQLSQLSTFNITAAIPSSPLTGSMYLDVAQNRLYVYNGTSWRYASLSA